MSAKRLAVLVVPIFLFVSITVAQDRPNTPDEVNELSVTYGVSLVSTRTITNPPAGDPDPRIRFGNEESVGFSYSRFLKQKKIFGFYGEVPGAIYFRMDLNTYTNSIPKDIGALFITPSVRMTIFSGDSVTPWVSAGGGYGRFREAPELNFYGTNPGATGTNTGVVQFGAGLDAWVWHHWGARFEARDFFSGSPDYVLQTSGRQHNYFVGVGVIHRF